MKALVLREIEIENFKSYQGTHVIGPFKHFTAVVGPNGCGKSNLMEAMTFVLGEKISKLRVKEQKDLIFGAHLSLNTTKFTYVAARFLHDENQLSLCRRLTYTSDTFYINNDEVTRSSYLSFLEEYGIFLKIKNFMVFQGDIDKIISENSKNISYLFERFSGSIRLKKAYDQKQKNLKLNMDQFTACMKNKRDALVQKQTLDQQKSEAGKYNEFKQKLMAHERDIYLLKLRLIELELGRLENLSNSSNYDRIKAETDLLNLKESQILFKSESSKIFREISLKEKKLDDFRFNLNKIQPAFDADKDKISHVRTKISSNQKNLSLIINNISKTKDRITDLEKTLNEAQKILGIEEFLKVGSIQNRLNEDQYDEYAAIKQNIINKTQKERDALNKATNERDLILSKVNSLNSTILNLEKRRESIATNENDLLEKIDKNNNTKEKYDLTINELNARRENLYAQILAAKTAVNNYSANLESVNQAISNYKIDLINYEREKKFTEIIEKLRLLFNGVHGRLLDLIEPIHRKYTVPITKVLGRHIDAIVVDSKKVAFDCIEYLRQQQLGRFIFLPLNDIKGKKINEKYRYLGGSSRLLIDTVKFDSIFRNIVEFALGSTIVCEDVDESLRLSTSLIERRKVVSMDGTLFLKNGIISGGSKTLNRKAQRWDDKRLLSLKRERDDLQNSIKLQLEIIHKEKSLDELVFEIKAYQEKENLLVAEGSFFEKSLSAFSKENSCILKLIEETNSEKYQLEKLLQKKQAEIKIAEQIVKDFSKKKLSEFCKKYSIDDIENYEESSASKIKEMLIHRQTCQKHIDVLTNQIEYEKSKLSMDRRESLEKMIAEDTETLNHLTMLQGSAQLEIQTIESNIKSLLSDIETHKKLYDEKNKNLKELSSQVSVLDRQITRLKQDTSSLEIKQEHFVNEKYQLLKILKSLGIAFNVLEPLSDLPELASQSQNTEKLTNFERIITYGTEKYFDVHNKIKPDFTQLSKIHDIDEIKDSIENLNIDTENLKIKINKTIPPNLKALQDYEERMESIKNITEEFQTAKQNVKDAQKEFEDVKNERINLFMNIFNIVSTQITNIYRNICNNNSIQAFLTLEDNEEPYLGGVDYNFVPPNKGYQQIHKLSGGEKSLAALALLFALQSVHPPPFVILDEVDAALDAENVLNLANYLKRHTKAEVPHIVISLKEELFNKANGLIGVTSTPNSEVTVSKIFTLNLDKYSK